jgi:nitric oxide reductase large subunit
VNQAALLAVSSILRLAGPLIGMLVGIVAYAYFHKHQVRPDAVDMRNLWLLIAAEIGVVTLTLSYLFARIAGPHQENDSATHPLPADVIING